MLMFLLEGLKGWRKESMDSVDSPHTPHPLSESDQSPIIALNNARPNPLMVPEQAMKEGVSLYIISVVIVNLISFILYKPIYPSQGVVT